jgi:hypothetical protein
MLQIAPWIGGALSRQSRLVKLKSRQVQRDGVELDVARQRVVSSLRKRLATPSSLLACVAAGYLLVPRRQDDPAPRRHTSRRSSVIAVALALQRLATAYATRESRQVTEVPDPSV